MTSARREAETVMFGALDELFAKTGVRAKDVQWASWSSTAASSSFNPTLSLSDMVVNHYKLRGNVVSQPQPRRDGMQRGAHRRRPRSAPGTCSRCTPARTTWSSARRTSPSIAGWYLGNVRPLHARVQLPVPHGRRRRPLLRQRHAAGGGRQGGRVSAVSTEAPRTKRTKGRFIIPEWAE
jgi:hypothetical protein